MAHKENVTAMNEYGKTALRIYNRMATKEKKYGKTARTIYSGMTTEWTPKKDIPAPVKQASPYLAFLRDSGYVEACKSWGSRYHGNVLLYRKREIHVETPQMCELINRIMDFRMSKCPDPEIGGYEGWLEISGHLYRASCEERGSIFIKSLGRLSGY